MRVPSALVVLFLLVAGCAADPSSGADAPSETAPAGGVAADDPLAALQGEWQSTDDPAVVVRVAGGRFTETYDGQTMVDEPVRDVDACADGPPTADGPFFQVGADFCYAIVESTPTTLAYMMMGGRGNTLSFRRAGESGEFATEPEQGEERDPTALFGEAVCEALRPALLTGATDGLERYATPEVLATLAADARAGSPPSADDVRAWSDGGETCNLSAGGDAWYELTLMGDGHVGQNAVSVQMRTSN